MGKLSWTLIVIFAIVNMVSINYVYKLISLIAIILILLIKQRPKNYFEKTRRL